MMMSETGTSTLNDFYEHVRREGRLLTTNHAHRWTNGVLRTLGLQLDGRTKKKVAKGLPRELAGSLTGTFWLVNLREPNMTAREFQQHCARRSGNTDATFARLPILAIFNAIKGMINSDLSQTVADALPPEVRQLWHEA